MRACVCACVRACVRACARVRVRVRLPLCSHARSCQLEGMFGGNVEELAKTVQCPFYFMPAGGDSPALYGPDGSLVKVWPQTGYSLACALSLVL